MLIASSDELEEMMSLLLGQPSVAHFVNDQQTRGDIASQTLAQQAGMRSALQRLCQVCQRRKHHGMARCERPIRKRQTQMRFPCSGRAQEHQIGAGPDKGEIGQFPQSALREGWLGAPAISYG